MFFRRCFLIIIAVILVSAITFWFYLCPLFYPFPKPSGSYCVGYSQFVWSASKVEPERAAFPVELFYPAECAQNVNETYPYQVTKLKALATYQGSTSWIPVFMWRSVLYGIRSYAQPEAALANTERSYPVIIYLPGIGGIDLHNLYLEELASHGYIICAIQPPFDTAVTVFPDGTAINLDPKFQRAMTHNNRNAIYAYRNAAHVRWTQYINAALQQLQTLNSDPQSLLFQKLDLNRLGLLGHSHGGAVVTDFCQHDDRCAAGVNMDGWTKTYNTGDAFTTPFLFVLSESGEMPEMQTLFEHNKRPDFHKIIVSGAEHVAATDLALVKQPLARWLGLVSGDTNTVIKQIKEALVAFFNEYLR